MFYQFKFCCGREEENEEAIAKPEKANKNNNIITFLSKESNLHHPVTQPSRNHYYSMIRKKKFKH